MSIQSFWIQNEQEGQLSGQRRGAAFHCIFRCCTHVGHGLVLDATCNHRAARQGSHEGHQSFWACQGSVWRSVHWWNSCHSFPPKNVRVRLGFHRFSWLFGHLFRPFWPSETDHRTPTCRTDGTCRTVACCVGVEDLKGVQESWARPSGLQPPYGQSEPGHGLDLPKYLVRMAISSNMRYLTCREINATKTKEMGCVKPRVPLTHMWNKHVQTVERTKCVETS